MQKDILSLLLFPRQDNGEIEQTVKHPMSQQMHLLILKLQREQLFARSFKPHCNHFHNDSWLNFKLTSLTELLPS